MKRIFLILIAMAMLLIVFPFTSPASTTGPMEKYQAVQLDTGVSVFDFVLCSDIGPIGIINSAQSILLSGKSNVRSYWQIINSIRGNLVLKYPFGEKHV